MGEAVGDEDGDETEPGGVTRGFGVLEGVTVSEFDTRVGKVVEPFASFWSCAFELEFKSVRP